MIAAENARLFALLETSLADGVIALLSLPGVVRRFQSFSEAADEAAASRIYAGQHFRYDEDAGRALGDQVADLVFDSILRPCGHHAGAPHS